MLSNPEKAKTCFQTAKIYIKNLIINEGEQKFKKINMGNKAFKAKIEDCFGGIQLLEAIGFKQ